MPPTPRAEETTALLIAWGQGDREAGEQVFALFYQDLRNIAREYLRHEAPGHTLQATALVHDLYLRLFGDAKIEWKCRAHFFVIATRQMRRLLTDHARAKRALKRDPNQLDPDERPLAVLPVTEEAIAVAEALTEFELLDPRAAQVVDLRYFSGLTEAETAEMLGISVATVKRDWDVARSWLFNKLRGREIVLPI